MTSRAMNFHAKNNGFSLIEVMVATTILMIIAVMIGQVFRGATSSWDTGYANAEGGMIVRGVTGAIQRELSTAVDGRRFKSYASGAWTSEHPIEVTDTTLTFICLKEAELDESGNLTRREPMKITYSFAGGELRREAKTFKNNNGSWSLVSEPASIIFSNDSTGERKAVYEATFKFKAGTNDDGLRGHEDPDSSQYSGDSMFADDYFWDIPYVSITVELERISHFSGFEVRSLGPDGKPNTDDDIIVR